MSEKTGVDSALQAFFRLCIMVGALVVGGMAFHLYGPPLGKVSELVDRMVADASQMISGKAARMPQAFEQPPTVHPLGFADKLRPLESPPGPGLGVAAAEELTPLAPLRSSVQPAGFLTDVPAPATNTQVQILLRRLEEMGAVNPSLSTWGAEGRLHRFECSAPLPGGSGFVRHFDAIDTDAEQAVRQVLQSVESWRQALAHSLPAPGGL